MSEGCNDDHELPRDRSTGTLIARPTMKSPYSPGLLAAACMVLAIASCMALSSCGGKSAAGVVVTYNCTANLNEVRALEKELPDFAARTGAQLKLLPFSGDDKLVTMMASNQAPDLFYTSSVMRDRFAAEGRILDLRPFLRRDSLATRLWPALLDASRSIDSGVYSIPNWVYTCGVYYNRALFRDAGIPEPDSSWTWDDMRRIARQLTRDRDGDGTPEQYGIHIAGHLLEIFETMNHAPISRDELYFHMPPESREVYTLYRALLDERMMPDPLRVQAMGMHPHQLLQSGKVAMLVEAVPNTDVFRMLTIDWGLLPLPRFGAKPPRYFRAASGGLSISAQCAHPDLAWKALRWLIERAAVYQPNPVLRDVDFIGGWIAKYPVLRDNGFARVWRLSEQYPGPDDRYFVRFSSWTMNPIMEMLQPKLDQFFARRITADDIAASANAANDRARRELDRILARKSLKPVFLEPLRRAMEDAKR
jgi:ABC-type glycerol-3-phosphate transport system substrate-binding protein